MRSPRVTIIHSSPRTRGNSIALGSRLLAGVTDHGGESVQYFLHGMAASPCNACDACQKSSEYRCVIDDDLKPVLKSAAECDYLVLTGPVYNFNVSAQLKIFLDRSYCLWKPSGSVLAGTKIVTILTYGDEDAESSGVFNALSALKDGYRFVKADVVKTLHYTAGGLGDILGNQHALDEAYATGKAIAERQL